MLIPGFSHNFELQLRGGYEGPNIPAAEHFSGVEIEQALARELIQNALDAKLPTNNKVEVDFDLQMMNVDDIPDVDNLRDTVTRAAKEAKDLEGGRALEDAIVAFAKSSVPVLCIGDSGTTGLTGSESVDDPHSALSSLTRSVGASSSQGDRGGSFGIGSSVGVLASRMRTVVYISKPIGTGETVLASTARFASFKDGESRWRQSTGHLTAVNEQDLRYPRKSEKIGPFVPRTQAGTDVYVLDYSGAETDPGLLGVKRSAAENFWAAIHEGTLIVRGSSAAGDWLLSTETLESELRNDEYLAKSTLPFYLALTTGTAIRQRLHHVGDVELYVNFDDLPEGMHFVQLMRRPLMKVENYEQRGLTVAAVFICRDESGNELLRKIEPPAHDRWNNRGQRSHAKAVEEIRQFVRSEIRALVPKQLGEIAEIKGLARFLPTPAKATDLSGRDGPDREGSGDENAPEGSIELGVPSLSSLREWKANELVALPTPAIAGVDGSLGLRGEREGAKPRGGERGRPTTTTPAKPGDGRSRLSSNDVSLRAFVPKGSSETTLVITALEAVSGDLELTAIGSDRDFDLRIVSAAITHDGKNRALEVDGSTVRGLAVGPIPIKVLVRFSTGRRYRLGVRDG
jgi:hypothetical protein